MKLRRIILWGTVVGLLAGVGTAQLPSAFGHDEAGSHTPSASELAALPDVVPALDAEGKVVACIKNPVKYPDDPSTLWWPPGLEPTGLEGSYAVTNADGSESIVTESIDVSAAVANTNAIVRAQRGQPKNC